MNVAPDPSAFIPFDNSYVRLPERFYARLAPTPVSAPRQIRVNRGLAVALGLDPDILSAPDGIAVLAGNRVPGGAEPLAMAYAGHQFGGFVPQLGDGRAILLGEIVGRDGLRRDIQLKGSGPTPFSRMGDGRAWLGPVLREYIVSEAMAALGIPTTRALAAVATGDWVMRESPLPGAVLTRVARSHVRVGTFQYFAARRDTEAVRLLADHVIDRLYPEIGDKDDRYRRLLAAVIARQADLVAQWQAVGFIHGVMNTDNMSIAGETIDYGPCAFMDDYDPATVFSSIDQHGRYAYGNQPNIAHWNLACLAQCLLPLLDDDQQRAIAIGQEEVDGFVARFDAAWRARMGAKIGLIGPVTDEDRDLVVDLLGRMAAGKADFTLTFRRLSDLSGADAGADGPVRDLFDDPSGFDAWAVRWRRRLAADGRDDPARRDAMRALNPAFIPRNHRVEEAIAAAVAEDFGPFETLVEILGRPFDDQPDCTSYTEPPKPEEIVRQTFCGT